MWAGFGPRTSSRQVRDWGLRTGRTILDQQLIKELKRDFWKLRQVDEILLEPLVLRRLDDVDCPGQPGVFAIGCE